jgi:DNA invertase Pin-like site-specific DNA recombinase
VFVDNDISAFSGASRPAYQQLLAELAEGAFAAILAWDGDRLHRSSRELEDFLDVIEATGAIVVTVTSGAIDLTTATGRMQARIKGDISRYESEHQTERTMAAHAYLAEDRPLEGRPPPLRLRRRPPQSRPAAARRAAGGHPRRGQHRDRGCSKGAGRRVALHHPGGTRNRRACTTVRRRPAQPPRLAGRARRDRRPRSQQRVRAVPDTKLETVCSNSGESCLQRQRERIIGVLARAIVNPTPKRGPTFDHGRVELVWRTEVMPTT